MSEPREKSGSSASDKSAADKQDPAATLAPILKGIEAAIRESKAEEDKAERQSQRDREAADLKAQQDMALWAKWMFIANAATVVLTFAALVAILRTLHHTRRAADSSQEMAEHGKLSTKAAIDAAAATTDSANFMLQRELPIIVVSSIGEMMGIPKPIEMDRPYSGWDIEVPHKFNAIPRVNLRNYGATPAFPYEIALGHAVTRELVGTPTYIALTTFEAVSVIKPEPQEDPCTAQVHFGVYLADEEVARLKAKDGWLWLFGAVRYRDFMGESHESCFCWRWAQRPDGEGSYHFAADGNPPADFVRRSWLSRPKRP